MKDKDIRIKELFPTVISDNEHFEYQLIDSTAIKEMYIYYDDDKIIWAHLEHLISDLELIIGLYWLVLVTHLVKALQVNSFFKEQR